MTKWRGFFWLTAASIRLATCTGTGWSVPLFLFYSETNDDVALLSAAPTVASDYHKIYPQPVALAHALQPAKYPLVTLRAYWSEERADVQTSTKSLAELNEHGGNYTFLEDVGLLAASVGPGVAAKDFAPLWLTYDESRTDSATAPLSSADLNSLLPSSPAFAFRAGHHLSGFAARGDCEVCNVSMSETWPSAGGADCAYECPAGKTSKTYIYHYDDGFAAGSAKAAFNDQMEAAGSVLASFGPATVSNGSKLHISFGYWCCYGSVDHAIIRSVLEEYPWPETTVSFDQLNIRIDSDAATLADHYSFILMLDEVSQVAMHAVSLDVEARVRDAGVDVHVPRADQEPFHSTLAVVDGTSFPSAAALAAVDAAVAPGNWTAGIGPVKLISPRF